MQYMHFSGSSASNIAAIPVKTWIKHKQLKDLKKQQLGCIREILEETKEVKKQNCIEEVS